VQAAGQQAGNVQSAIVCCASSVQVKPENTNLSGGDGGSTRQQNTSSALGAAANLNGLEQQIGQGSGLEPAYDGHAADAPALTDRAAPHPDAVGQSNDSTAVSLAGNANLTGQTITQAYDGPPAGVTVQAAGQAAGNEQYATSSASSFQLEPRNVNGSIGVLDGACDEHALPAPGPSCGKPAPPPCGPCAHPAPKPCLPTCRPPKISTCPGWTPVVGTEVR
jgi:hypothetical protein